jgi:hypothetical protein
MLGFGNYRKRQDGGGAKLLKTRAGNGDRTRDVSGKIGSRLKTKRIMSMVPFPNP